MLVLSRKADESIVIDGHIHIKVLQVKGTRIRLGIEAPADVRIRRAEIAPFKTVAVRDTVHDSRSA